MAGVKLNNNTATDNTKRTEILEGVGVAVAGVKLNNNTATDNTKRTEILELATCRIFVKHYENEE